MTMPKLKKKTSSADDEQVDLDFSAANDPAEAKDEDFDLDMDSANYTGRKGQAGTRSRD